MAPRHAALALGVAVIWGMSFLVSKHALLTFTPAQLTALRFLIGAIATLWLPRPAIPWSSIVWIGLSLFTGQFLLMFFGIAAGMPVGLTAIVVQSQALFTVGLAALLLGERPTRAQLLGLFVALAGLVIIAASLGVDVPVAAFALVLACAISWASGNLLLKRVPTVNMLNLVAWASLVPPIPALAVSWWVDGLDTLLPNLAGACASALLALLYMGLVSSVLAYAIWGNLLRCYTAATIAPFSLLAPIVGTSASALVYGERFSPVRIVGMGCVLLSLVISTGVLARVFQRGRPPG